VRKEAGMKLVVAGNYQEFKYYYPKSDRNIRYVHCCEDIIGYHCAEIERVGTWWRLPIDFLTKLNIIESKFNFERERRKDFSNDPK
jgi:hypothetical protein